MELEPLPQAELSEQDQVKHRALVDWDDIRSLRKFAPFHRYFLRRLQEKREPLVSELLRSKLSPEDFREKQVRLAVLEEVSKMLDDDEAGNLSIVRQE